MRQRTIVAYNLIFLCFLYFLIGLMFSLVFMFLDVQDLGRVMDHYAASSHQEQTLDRFTRSLYFSYITLFSVGYGDLTPLGLSKGVAILEAMLGYILPAVFVINCIIYIPPSKRYSASTISEKRKL